MGQITGIPNVYVTEPLWSGSVANKSGGLTTVTDSSFPDLL